MEGAQMGRAPKGLTAREARELRPVVRAMAAAAARIDADRPSAWQLSDWSARLQAQIAEVLREDRREAAG